MIGANNSWCLAYDNLSTIPAWLSDALCRLSTGGGFATRELYTDQDEVIFDSQRPVLLTSIEEVATRSDLLDRCLIIWLPAIPEDQRRREEEIGQAFEAVRPQILGALLDAVSGALRDLPNTQLTTLPRMADFAHWVTAAEKSLGWPSGTMMAAHMGNQQSVNDLALEASPVAGPLLQILQDDGAWVGTASELFDVLQRRASDQVKRQKAWPKSASALAGQLKRLAPNLREAGWSVDYQRQSSRRLWTIRRMTAATTSVASSGVTATAGCSLQSDAKRCDPYSDDADDGDDAVLQATEMDLEPNESWEESSL